jgi:uncharacterized membrane protein
MFLKAHLARCFLAGTVAILPIGGTVLAVVWAENLIRTSLLAGSARYFPGLGLLLVAALVYGVGLVVTTVLGRWLWRIADRMLNRLPALGQLYQTLEQILGYGAGKDALFEQVVLVPSGDSGGEQLGLVTSAWRDAGGGERCAVFVPDSPNPMAGRLVIVPRSELRAVDLRVHDALKALVSLGKTDLARVSRAP